MYIWREKSGLTLAVRGGGGGGGEGWGALMGVELASI